jgi:DDE superfamily endonuclease
LRVPSKPSTAHCTLDLYVRYLLAQPQGSGCCHLAEILESLSHDSVNRFLSREHYEPKDLFEVMRLLIELEGGVLSGDDTVIEKPYADVKKTLLLGYYWSSKHSKAVLGISLITLYYTSANGLRVPINYRLYSKEDNKTKNDYFREMIEEVLHWGVRPRAVTTDAWYASKANLKQLIHHQLGFMVGVAKNRLVSVAGGKYQRIDSLTIPQDGQLMHLKGVGQVKGFCKEYKDGSCRYYLLYLPDSEALAAATAQEFDDLHAMHWGIECFHRAAKQLCGLQRFRVRLSAAIHTHVFCSLRAFIELELRCWHQQMGNWYELQRQLYREVARRFIVQEPLRSGVP